METQTICILCSGDADEPCHTEGNEHKLAAARTVIDLVETFGECPYCEPKGRPRLITKLEDCQVAEHAEKIKLCRELVAGHEIPIA
jgi:hypothetical protein